MRLESEIDRLCDEFESCWKSKARPEIHGYLERISSAARAALLRQLIPVELEGRLQQGELPKVEDYRSLGDETVAFVKGELCRLEASGRLTPKIFDAGHSGNARGSASDVPLQRGDSANDATIIGQVEIRAERDESNNDYGKVRYFGDYELLNEIDRGGMGVVYKARQTDLNRVVALKMILAGQLASDEEVQRFRTEAEAAANLDHPGIVPIYEIGQHEGQHFFSMGYVDGCSLADRVRNGPLPPKEAAELTKKIAEAIAFAHSRNVIHRDLKPANVLLDKNGEPKVTDFGLARKTDTDSGMTRTGAAMGTPSYMPPEQADGQWDKVGPVSDVYSLGATLYCLLTGRPPFQAANSIETLRQVLEREPVSVSTINPEIQRDLETICHKCLQKEPAKRYVSAQELAEDIGRWLRGEPIQARAVSTTERMYRWVRRNPVVSGLTAAVLLVLVMGSLTTLWFGLAARAAAGKMAYYAQQNAELVRAEARFRQDPSLLIRAIEQKVSTTADASSFELLELGQIIFSGKRKGTGNLVAVIVNRNLERTETNSESLDQQLVLSLPPMPAPAVAPLADASEIELELQRVIDAREANEVAIHDIAGRFGFIGARGFAGD